MGVLLSRCPAATYLLLLRRAPHRTAAPGLWETVSGRVFVGETALDAVTREVNEECGLQPDVRADAVDHYDIVRAGVPMPVTVFACEVLPERGRPPDIQRSDEHDADRWHPWSSTARSELLELGVPERLVDAIERAHAALT